MKEPQHEHTRRDAETQIALGAFIAILAVPVLIGTLWATSTVAGVVNLAAGGILFFIGLGFLVYGLRGMKRLPK